MDLLSDLRDWTQGRFRVESGEPTSEERELFRICAVGLVPAIVVYGVVRNVGLVVGAGWICCFGLAAYYRNWKPT